MGKLSKKKIYKLAHKRCFFCDENDENLLDAHRIIPGSEKGKYININMLCVCSIQQKEARLIHQLASIRNQKTFQEVMERAEVWGEVFIKVSG